MTPTQSQTLTLIFILAVTAIVIGYDVAILYTSGVDATISRSARWVFARHPTVFIMVVFWLGVFVGHVAFPCD